MIDYQYVDQISSNIKSRGKDFHDNFMHSIGHVLHRPQSVEISIPNQPTKSFLAGHPFYGRRPKSRQAGNIAPLDMGLVPNVDEESQIRPRSSVANELLNREVSELGCIVSKLPLERSRKEKKQAHELFCRLFPEGLKSTIDYPDKNTVLRHLIHGSAMMAYPSTGMPIFKNSGVYMVLEGCIRAVSSYAHPQQIRESPASRASTSRRIRLYPGDCVGNFERGPEGEDMIQTRMCIAVTAEPSKLLHLSRREYERITAMLKDQELSAKTSVVHNCECYTKWPGLSIKALASCVKWQHFPANSIIFNEGEVSPFIAFIKSGTCQVFKQVEAMKTLPNGRKVKWCKQVHMGTVTKGQSVGEESMLSKKLLPFSVIASTDVEIARLDEASLNDVDETTTTLLIQSAKAAFPSVSMDEVQQIFVEQEMKLEWQKLKQKTLLQTVNYCGIRPGCGKWKH